MDDFEIHRRPASLEGIRRDTEALRFDMSSEPRVGALLAALVAQRHLASDTRVTFHVMDGADFLRRSSNQFDLIYADAWPGKFSQLDEALSLLRPGGIYVIDDLLPQPNWPEGHAPKVPALIDDIEGRAEFVTVRLAWASGLMLVVRRAS